MLEPALIEKCADHSLRPAIVEQFVAATGSSDPLAITVKSGGRLILVPKAKSADEAMAIIGQYVGHAIVRVGLTQFPAGVGVKDASELDSDFVDPCTNLRMGTSMFAKVLRVVAKWYGNPKSDEVFPQIFDDAIHAWRTGKFEGQNVFLAEDPRGTVAELRSDHLRRDAADMSDQSVDLGIAPSQSDVQNAGIRIDLSRIGGQK